MELCVAAWCGQGKDEGQRRHQRGAARARMKGGWRQVMRAPIGVRRLLHHEELINFRSLCL